MGCTACGGELPTGFPGATVICACGAPHTFPSAVSGTVQPSATPTGGPYRAPAATPPAEGVTICPYCSNACPPLVRVCPHCDVRLESVRCVRCFALQPPGSFACGRCAQPLELEPVLDATDAPCPRCATPLEAGGDARHGLDDPRVHECPRCGGIFVPRAILAEILSRAELAGPFPMPAPRAIPPLDQVRYLACPQCKASMNRTNFGRSSGVIVDVCRAHGTWFDAGELTRVVVFAASGGLAKSRERAKDDKRAEAARAASLRVEAIVADARAEARVDAWRRFLDDLFLW